MPSDELADELQRHLENRGFTGANYDKSRRTIQFSDSMDPSQWSSVRSTVDKWTKGKNLELVESLKVQSRKHEATQEKESPKSEEDLTKKLDRLTFQQAEERYNYLRSKSISELTDAEYEERLALVQQLSGKAKAQKK